MHDRMAEADGSEEKASATAATVRSPPSATSGKIRFITPIIGTTAPTERATTGWPSQARCPKSVVCIIGRCWRGVDPWLLWKQPTRADRCPHSKGHFRESPITPPPAGEAFLWER